MALFHAKQNGDLMPIAIQLYQKPAEDNPVNRCIADSNSIKTLLNVNIRYIKVAFFILPIYRCFYQVIRNINGC